MPFQSKCTVHHSVEKQMGHKEGLRLHIYLLLAWKFVAHHFELNKISMGAFIAVWKIYSQYKKFMFAFRIGCVGCLHVWFWIDAIGIASKNWVVELGGKWGKFVVIQFDMQFITWKLFYINTKFADWEHNPPSTHTYTPIW